MLCCAQALALPRRIDSLKLALNSATDKERVEILNELAREYRYISLDSSFMFAQQARTLADKLGDKLGVGLALRSMGQVYENQGRYDMALEHQIRALAAFEEANYYPGIASASNLIGDIYRAQEKYDKALDNYHRALAIHRSMNNKERIATVLGNVAVCYMRQGKFTEALDTLLYAEALYKQVGSPHIVWSWLNLSEYYIKQQDYASSLKYALQVYDTARVISDHLSTTAALHTIGLCYSRLGKPDSALHYALRSKEEALRSGFRNELKQTYFVLSEIHQDARRYDSALYYYKHFARLRDSLLSAEMQSNVAALQMQLETSKQEEHIKRLSLLRNSLIVGVFLLLFIAGLIANGYRSKKRSEEELKRINNEILRQQAILEKQAAEIELTNTELQSTIESLHQRNYELAELNREKNEILGIVAHDLKNPVSNIRMLAKLIRDEAESLSTAEIIEFSGDIYTVSERMFELITTLLDVSAIEQGTLRFTFSVFEIASLAENVVNNYKARAQAKNITLHFEQNQNREGLERYTLVAYADKNATLQVLDNLLSNAVKYSPYGKNVWVRVLDDYANVLADETPKDNLLAPPQEYVRIEVQDEGPGFTEEDKKKLFGKFTRLSAKPTGGEHSTGLGLSIVKKMVEGMNGKIWLESEVGKGATFIVLLPKGDAVI
ncbi:MAG: tetratricopeptide repeat-containing sensor histidine kinase [Bacteroidota bacterium]|nr:tetratricopeptide repeat-containing sensor histidine kinase [Candidatus Kapabacteria bacterium]MDW8219775.1 tetratricopeptide repeat-containing sensor histidine kinase [Bacteroidota bacterium]